jgi:Holliday junction resolvase RusA-like endonuclease
MATISKKQYGELNGKAKSRPRRNHKRYSVDEATEPITFKVSANKLITKPRIVKSDLWKKRPHVEEWYAWKDLIAQCYKEAGGKTFLKPVKVSYWFYVQEGRKLDNDNLIKGVNDSLNGLAWIDDNVKRLRHIGCSYVEFIAKGKKEYCYVKIEPI